MDRQELLADIARLEMDIRLILNINLKPTNVNYLNINKLLKYRDRLRYIIDKNCK